MGYNTFWDLFKPERRAPCSPRKFVTHTLPHRRMSPASHLLCGYKSEQAFASCRHSLTLTSDIRHNTQQMALQSPDSRAFLSKKPPAAAMERQEAARPADPAAARADQAAHLREPVPVLHHPRGTRAQGRRQEQRWRRPPRFPRWLTRLERCRMLSLNSGFSSSATSHCI